MKKNFLFLKLFFILGLSFSAQAQWGTPTPPAPSAPPPPLPTPSTPPAPPIAPPSNPVAPTPPPVPSTPPTTATPTVPPANLQVSTQKYSIQGTSPDGKAYTGSVTVFQKGEVYIFNWQVGGNSMGVGVKTGSVISVGWTTADKTAYGVASYTIENNGTLKGTWAIPSDMRPGTELLTPVP